MERGKEVVGTRFSDICRKRIKPAKYCDAKLQVVQWRELMLQETGSCFIFVVAGTVVASSTSKSCEQSKSTVYLSTNLSSQLLPSLPLHHHHAAALEIQRTIVRGKSTAMAVTMKQMAMLVAFLGALSFILGVVAENKKPPSGTPITGKGVVICKYASDASVALGYTSFAFLIVCMVAGWYSLFYPYKGKHVPKAALFQNKAFLVFFCIALATSVFAVVMLLWPTITEQLHHTNNVHHNLETSCPTAKTGLLGGGAFLSLDSCLFFLVALMLVDNARADYFGESDDKISGNYEVDPIKGSA